MLEPLGFYVTTMFEKTATTKTPVSNLVYEAYNNGLEEALEYRTQGTTKCASDAKAETAFKSLGREVFFDFSTKLFLNK